MTTMEVEKVEIDESLYSRQEIMLGKAAMQKMAVSNVFVSGLGGVGVEIAKNVALAGVKQLTIHDTKHASWLDLSTQFYLSPQEIGKNRAEASISQISQLNPHVKYSVSTVDLDTEPLSFFDSFKCVILTDASHQTQIRINEYCHQKGISFIAADVRGVFTYAFCDFGEKFEVHDKNGEELKEILVGNISRAANGVVETLDTKAILHGLEDGDLITFREVKGMTQINNTTHKIKVLTPYTFSIGDTSSFGEFQKGSGIAQQVRETLTLSFKSLKQSIADPELILSDFAKLEAPAQMHVAFQALAKFETKHTRLPQPWNAEDANTMVSLAKEINATINEDIVRSLSFTARGSIVGLTAFTGGIVAQECLKSLSGKYTPLKQWLYLDAMEVLEPLNSDPAIFQPENSRYDGELICLGKHVVNKLADVKTFMIGCGAIGCEMLKNFAMLGIAHGKGKITITDNDLIEKSNLNRQFLFRPKDIQHPKSETASKAVCVMNPDLNGKIEAFLDKVGPDTEDKYSDRFFEGLDFVVNALDNVNARLYVDSRCVTNKKALLESGTLGPKGHVQVVIPYQTESYGSQRDPPEKDVPFCTLKSFPNQIEHCIEWARDFSFGGIFVSKPMQWKQLTEENNLVEKLKQHHGGGIDFKVMRTGLKLLKNRPTHFDDCLAFSRQKFEAYYVNKAIQLLHNFPLDHKIDDKGTLFWSSPKRPPTITHFNWEDPIHRQFVISMANLYAEVWGIPRYSEIDRIKKTVDSVKISPFVPKSKRIETDEKKKKEEVEVTSTGPEDDLNKIRLELLHFFDSNAIIPRLKPIEFEKDDDTNFHIDFIAACANLRARMYSIAEVDRLKVKAIAGRIMPAIATTTAAVSGLVSIELVKLVKQLKVDKFKNLFMNLAIPLWTFSEPGAPEKKLITGDIYYTLWDKWDIKEGDLTLGQLIDHFQKRFNLEISGVFNGATMVYVPLFPGHAKRKTSKMSALLKRNPNQKYLDLVVMFANPKGEDVSGPPVRFHFE